MNIVKFKDILLAPMDFVNEHRARVAEPTDEGSDYTYEFLPCSPFYNKGYTVEEACEVFNTVYRNRYWYTINWNWLVPLTTPTQEYIEMSQNPDICIHALEGPLEDTIVPIEAYWPWLDNTVTSSIVDVERNKYHYLNEFTPDGEVTTDELRVFRRWLAGILLQNTPVIDQRPNSSTLRRMLTYYVQDMYDETVKVLSDMVPFMEQRSLVIGNTTSMNFLGTAALQLASGCGCSGANPGVGLVNGAAACDPLQMYRNSIYNFMVDTFSDIRYWTEQVEICGEMLKYIEGILKVCFPLASPVVDRYADCTCNTLDAKEQDRYTGMLRNLASALRHIINGETVGNLNFLSNAFNQWAVYLYENMMW